MIRLVHQSTVQCICDSYNVWIMIVTSHITIAQGFINSHLMVTAKIVPKDFRLGKGVILSLFISCTYHIKTSSKFPHLCSCCWPAISRGSYQSPWPIIVVHSSRFVSWDWPHIVIKQHGIQTVFKIPYMGYETSLFI